MLGRSINGGTIKNTVIVFNQAAGYTNGAIASWAVYTKTTVFDNVYMIMKGGATNVFGNTAAVEIKADSTYTVVAANEDPTAITYVGLDESIWNVTAGQIPTFKYVAPIIIDSGIENKTDTIIYLDASDLGGLSAQIASEVEKLGLFDSFSDVKIFDETGTEIPSDASWLKAHDTGNAAARTITLIVSDSGKAYKIKVLVVTKVITTYAELASLQSYTTVETGKNSAGKTYYSYGGYFVLGNNITATGSEAPFSAPSIGSISSGGDMVETYGFHGTFDGRGYTVSGFDF
ncbi:MAG: hypothetical protein J6N93_08630, partial [Clostridia bacterium]|nr:hypothetical protein [Clostridia bacterium]